MKVGGEGVVSLATGWHKKIGRHFNDLGGEITLSGSCGPEWNYIHVIMQEPSKNIFWWGPLLSA